MKVFTAEVPEDGCIGVFDSKEKAIKAIEAHVGDYFGDPLEWSDKPIEQTIFDRKLTRTWMSQFHASAHEYGFLYVTEWEVQ